LTRLAVFRAIFRGAVPAFAFFGLFFARLAPRGEGLTVFGARFAIPDLLD
jgi:hypothetical protein